MLPALIALAALPAAGWAADCALVVGIDEYRDDGPPKAASPDLFACASDARAFATLLKEMGLEPSNVRLLTDDAATRQAIRDGLAWLATASDSGSTAYFYYSGHGSTGLTDTDGDEPDGFDEGLVPTDVINPADYFEDYINDPQIKARVDGTQLYDDELEEALRKIGGRAAQVVVVLDSCHSAGATKGFAGQQRPGLKLYHAALGIDPTAKPWGGGNPSRPPAGGPGPSSGPLPGIVPGANPPAAGQAAAAGGASLQTQGVGDKLFYEGATALPNLVVLAASEPTQYSQADPELGHGSFTFALLNAVYNDVPRADIDADGRLSWYELGTYAHFWVSQRSQQQARESQDESMLQFPVLYNAEQAQRLFVAPQTLGQGRELLEPIALPKELME